MQSLYNCPALHLSASHCISLHHINTVWVSLISCKSYFIRQTKHSDAAWVVTMSFNCFITVVKTQEQICESNRDVGTDIDSLHHICSCLTDCNINNESETQFSTNILTHSSRTRNHKYLFPILLHPPHQLVCPDYLLWLTLMKVLCSRSTKHKKGKILQN